jgi:chromosome segregation ATPase
LVDHHMVRPADGERVPDADELLARAREEAEQIRRDALVTAEGIRRIALEDAEELRLTATTADPQAGAELARLHDAVARLERKVKNQRRRIERLEAERPAPVPGCVALTRGLLRNVTGIAATLGRWARPTR